MEHHHDHSLNPQSLNRAFIIGIALNFAFVIIQASIGFKINSLSLLSDAGHNFLDVGALTLSLLAFKLAKVKSSDKYTFGYKKATIIISLFNSVLLLVTIGAIAIEAIERFKDPEPLPGDIISIVSFVGIIINGASAFLFFRDKNKDLNVKSAFLHLLADALFSLGLVIGGIIIYSTHLYWIDPLLSIMICLVLLFSTWNLLKDSLRLSLDGVPDKIDIEKIKQAATKINGVLDFHHLHVWAISTTDNALTGHLVVSSSLSNDQILRIKNNLKHELEHLNVGHCTIEIETDNMKCEDENCRA